MTLTARTRDGRSLEGQAVACHSRTALERVGLRAAHEVVPYQPALEAIREADLIVLGPGSLFTSIIPNLLVPGVVDAIRASKGSTLFVCSLADMQGETWGLTAREHVEALMDHGTRGLLDYVLVHTPVSLRPDSPATGVFTAVTGKGRAGSRPSHVLALREGDAGRARAHRRNAVLQRPGKVPHRDSNRRAVRGAPHHQAAARAVPSRDEPHGAPQRAAQDPELPH